MVHIVTITSTLIDKITILQKSFLHGKDLKAIDWQLLHYLFLYSYSDFMKIRNDEKNCLILSLELKTLVGCLFQSQTSSYSHNPLSYLDIFFMSLQAFDQIQDFNTTIQLFSEQFNENYQNRFQQKYFSRFMYYEHFSQFSLRNFLFLNYLKHHN